MISVTTISPAKNSTNISVNEDIFIEVNADFELDPRNVSFKINDVDIIPNVFSIYNGPSDTSLEITLYTRRRIKYNTGKRYGEDGFQYGMRDVFPSILQYGSRYVIEFTIWGINNLGEKEELTDRFAFSTEEGVFYNSNPPDYFYSEGTQSIANYFPEWAKARYDKFSNIQQMINPLGQKLEEIEDFVTKQGLNNFIQTANMNELSSLNRIELGKDFEIISNLNQDGSVFYVQPEVSALKDITRYDLYTDGSNDLKSFYYNKLPTRISSERSVLTSNIIYGPSLASEIKTNIDKELEKTGVIRIKASGISSSVHSNERREVLVLRARLYGESLFGKKQIEDIILLNEREIESQKFWRKIDDIQFFNLLGQEVSFELKYFPEPCSLKEDSKLITTYEDNRELLFWDMLKMEGRSLLRKHIIQGQSGADYLRNSGLTNVIQEYELLDIDNSSKLELKDIAVDIYSNKIYAIDNNYLFIYDKREEYPSDLKKIPGNNGMADFVIELDTDETGLDENGEKEISLKCVHKNLGKTLIRYRLRLKKPDGSEVFVTDSGGYTTDMNQATIFIKNNNDYIIEERSHLFTTDQVGDHILELEALYKGGESSKHFQLVRVLKKKAIAKYKLDRILNEEIPVSICFDDQQLKILTENNTVHSLTLNKDGVLIDYENKILYFIEDYDLVDVE